MINHVNGDIFQTETEAILLPINCEGVMMSSLCKDFNTYYSEIYEALSKKNVDLRLGRVITIDILNKESKVKYVLVYPFRKKWLGEIEKYYVAMGLYYLAREIKDRDIKSISIPAFLCGKHGGNHEWPVMKEFIRDWHRLYEEILKPVDIRVYMPVVKK